MIEPSGIPSLKLCSMCPLVEMMHVRPKIVLDYPICNSSERGGRFSELIDGISSGATSYRSANGDIQFNSISNFSANGTAWTEFAIAIQRAAKIAGFSKDYSGKFAGAILELQDNIAKHSQKTHTGYIVFATSPQCFEFVVGDKGIGVLESLRTNPEYKDLSDSGLALDKALTYGVSRYGNDTGHGTGFKPTINGLANIAHKIRFRSGDYSCEYTRQSTGEIDSRTAQKYPMDGFFISVTCDSKVI